MVSILRPPHINTRCSCQQQASCQCTRHLRKASSGNEEECTCGLLLVHVNGDASLQVGPLNLSQLTTQRDHNHLTKNGLCLLHVLRHDRLVCPSQSQSRLQELAAIHSSCQCCNQAMNGKQLWQNAFIDNAAKVRDRTSVLETLTLTVGHHKQSMRATKSLICDTSIHQNAAVDKVSGLMSNVNKA